MVAVETTAEEEGQTEEESAGIRNGSMEGRREVGEGRAGRQAWQLGRDRAAVGGRRRWGVNR